MLASISEKKLAGIPYSEDNISLQRFFSLIPSLLLVVETCSVCLKTRKSGNAAKLEIPICDAITA